MVEELEQRERAFKKARVDKEREELERWRSNEDIMEQGRRLREQSEREAHMKEAEQRAQVPEEPDGAPTLGAFL